MSTNLVDVVNTESRGLNGGYSRRDVANIEQALVAEVDGFLM